MKHEQIECTIADHMLTITLNRPEQMNAFTTQMMRELVDALDSADMNDEVRAVIVTGRGRAFCAGGDLSTGPSTFDNVAQGRATSIDDNRDSGGTLALRIYNCKKPVIAALNGAAVGVGLTMTLPMDMRLAVKGAKLGLPFVRRGIVPDACAAWFLPRIVGVSTAVEWACNGRIFLAEEALAAGLVRALYAPEDLLPAARSIAREIAAHTSPVAVALTRRMFWEMAGAPDPETAHIIESKANFVLGQSPEAREGVMAFLEKRPPQFPLRVSTDVPEVFRPKTEV